MADPFGIIGVIGLAGQVLTSVVRLGLDLKDAPADCQGFVRQLQALKTALSETNTNLILNPDFVEAFHGHHSTVLSQLQSTSQLTDTHRMVTGCRDELDTLIKTLRKGSDHKLSWERIKATFLAQKIKDAVGNLQRQCQILNSLVAIDAAALGARTYVEVQHVRREQRETNAAVSQLHDRLDSREILKGRDQILEWLSSTNYASQHQDFIARRQPGTGQWLLNSEEYQEWSAKESSILFCPGIPGAGKTILTATVIDHLLHKHQGDPNIGIAYVYFNFQRQDSQKADDVTSSLLKQLCEQLGFIPDALDILYSDCKSKDKSRPPFAKLSECLQSTFAQYSKVFIVLDALDECQEIERRRFLDDLSIVQKNSSASIFATSRYIPDILDHFTNDLVLEIRARQDDVELYLEKNMNKLKPFVQRNSKLQQEIKSSISKAVDGMFLLAQTYLDLMGDMFTVKAIKKALANIQKQSQGASDDQKIKTLRAAYDEAMERISRQLPGSKDLALQVLSWLTFAKRPMTVLELRHALAVEIGEDDFDEDNIPDLDDIVTICSGLVTIDETSATIRLAHYTAQEYLQQTKDQWFPGAEGEIALACVSYLNFAAFESGLATDYDQRMREYPLYEYAASNWGYHAQGSLDSYEVILDLLECSGKLEAAFQVISKIRLDDEFFRAPELPVNGTGLHLLAYFGMLEAFDLPKVTNLLESKDGNNSTPIFWATANDQHTAVKRLIEKGADPNYEDEVGNTPIRVAARGGCADTVNILLTVGKVHPDPAIDSGSNFDAPLHLAAEKGHEDVVKILLRAGANPDRKDMEGVTPLMGATENGHEGVVKILLATGKVDVQSVIANGPSIRAGRSALWLAAFYGHTAIAQALLEHGATVKLHIYDTRPNPQQSIASLPSTQRGYIGSDITVLHLAAQRGHVQVVKLLLEKGMGGNEIFTKTTVKRERKYRRVEGTDSVVRYMKDWMQIVKRTPLSMAIETEHTAVADALKENGGVEIHEVQDVDLLPGSLEFDSHGISYVELVGEIRVRKRINYDP